MPNNTPPPVARPDRRTFIRASGLTAVVGQSGGAMAAHPTVPSAMAAADEMDRMHEAGIKAFPAKTERLGNQILAPKIVGGVKIFELTASRIQ